MPSLTVGALGQSSGSGGYQNAKPLPAVIPVPDFDVTIDNLHPTQAIDGDWRPIDLKIPLPGDDFNFTERWLHDTAAEWTVTIGAQVGTGVMGERYGNEYAYFHIRGIDVPAYQALENVAVERASAPSTPRYTMASEGLTQFTGTNAIQLHMDYPDAPHLPVFPPITLDDAEWVQTESGPGRHKWDQWVFSEESGLYWRIRCYTWPGIERVEVTAVCVWNDQRSPLENPFQTQLPQLEISVPVYHFIRAEFGYEKGMDAERIVSGRRRVALTQSVPIGDGQAVRCRLSIMPGAAPQAERDDWWNSIVWPVKCVADPEFWKGRIGPMRHAGDDCVYPIAEQWGDGGVTFKTHAWDHPRWGFRAHLASYNTPQRRKFYTQPPLTGGKKSNQVGARNTYGRQFLSHVLGIRGGFPRYLWLMGFNAYWDACMRPIQFPYWTIDGSYQPVEPTGRWIQPGDYTIGKTPNSAHELEQRINTGQHKWAEYFQNFGKPNDVPYHADRHSLGGVNGYRSSHHEMTLFGALALLDDIDDHWTDFLTINAGHYINNQRQFGSKDYLRLGEYRSGRSETMIAWTWDILPDASRDFLLDFWSRRFGNVAQLEDTAPPYADYWDHQAKRHEWTNWSSLHSYGFKAPLYDEYHPCWEFSMGAPGYSMVARLMSKYGQDDTGLKFFADQARVHLKYYWTTLNDPVGRWKTAYGANYPGRRTIDPKRPNSGYLEPELEGTGPPVAWFTDPTRFAVLKGIALYWWLGAIQEAGRLMTQEFGDADLAQRADEIVREIVDNNTPWIDSQGGTFLALEAHALGNFHTTPSIRITVGALGLDAVLGVIDAIPRRFDLSAMGMEAGPGPGIYPLNQLDPFPVLWEVNAIGLEAGHGAAIVDRPRIQIPVDALGLDGGLGEARGSRNVLVGAIGMEAGAGGLDHVTQLSFHTYRGTWRPGLTAFGGWETMETNQGITIVSGDNERLTVTVRDDDLDLVDCSTASDAVFTIVVPATPHSAEVELVRRSLVDGVDCSTGVAVIDIGDTSEINDTLGIWSLVLTISAVTQTVARAPCRIIGNPASSPDDDGDEPVEFA